MYSQQEHRNKHGQRWVNVASSTYVLEDFVNLDNCVFLYTVPLFNRCRWLIPRKYWEQHQLIVDAQQVAPLIKHDCRKPLPFPDESVDHILCSHFIEHIYPDEADQVLHDFHRALKVGGTLDLRVPDVRRLANDYLSDTKHMCQAADNFIRKTILSHEKHTSFRYRLLDFLGWSGHQHRWMYDRDSIQEKVTKIGGFEWVSENTTPSQGFRKDEDNEEVRIVFKKIRNGQKTGTGNG